MFVLRILTSLECKRLRVSRQFELSLLIPGPLIHLTGRETSFVGQLGDLFLGPHRVKAELLDECIDLVLLFPERKHGSYFCQIK